MFTYSAYFCSQHPHTCCRWAGLHDTAGGKYFFRFSNLGQQRAVVIVMSAGSRVEVLQSAEELKDHVCTDSPKATEEQHEEEGQLPAVLGKTVTLEPVGKDKQHKRTEVEKSPGRRRDARGTNREQVIQADGAAAGVWMHVRVKGRGETLSLTQVALLHALLACLSHMLISLLRFAWSYLRTCLL